MKMRLSLLIAIVLATITAPLPAQASLWSEPVAIDAGINDAYRTDVKFDNVGNAFAVFEQEKDGVFRIYANRYINGTGWGEPEIIDAGTGNAYRARLSIDRFGNAMAVFKHEEKGGYRLYSNHYELGRGWMGATPITDIIKGVDGQGAAFDAEGNAAVAFEGQEKDGYGIFVAHYSQEKGWQKAKRIDRGSGSGYFPSPAFDSSGSLHVLYFKEARHGLDLYASLLDPEKEGWSQPALIISDRGGTWKTKKSRLGWGNDQRLLDEVKANIYAGTYYYHYWSRTKVDARLRDAYTPSVVSGKDGNVTAFFISGDNGRLRAYTAAYAPGKGWGTPSFIDSGEEDVEHIRASINSKGEMAIVFTQYHTDRGEYLRVFARLYSPEKGWGEAEIIDAGEHFAYNPYVAISETGAIVAVWCQWIEFSNHFNPPVRTENPYGNVKSFANTFRPGSGWAKAERIEAKDFETCGVRLAMSPNGSVIAIFEQEGEYAGRADYVNRIFAVTLKDTQAVSDAK
jgi:hypothetical protein